MADKLLSQVTEEDIELGRKTIEDQLISFRDSRFSLPSRANGLVVKEQSGEPSCMIRMSIPDAVRMVLDTILKGK